MVGVHKKTNGPLKFERRSARAPDLTAYLWRKVLSTVVGDRPCPPVRVDDSGQRFVREQAEMFRTGHFQRHSKRRRRRRMENRQARIDAVFAVVKPSAAGRNDDVSKTE